MGHVKEKDLTPQEIKVAEAKAEVIAKIAEADRKVNAGEKIVNINESQALQSKGAEVVAVFIQDGVKVHKIKLPEKEKKAEKPKAAAKS